MPSHMQLGQRLQGELEPLRGRGLWVIGRPRHPLRELPQTLAIAGKRLALTIAENGRNTFHALLASDAHGGVNATQTLGIRVHCRPATQGDGTMRRLAFPDPSAGESAAGHGTQVQLVWCNQFLTDHLWDKMVVHWAFSPNGNPQGGIRMALRALAT